MLTIKFAKKLKELRVKAGVSQETLASQTGLHRTYISQLERGLKNPTIETLQKLCTILKIKPSRMIELIEDAE
jgi:transcriptional regulator with XRE-family HTH domain